MSANPRAWSLSLLAMIGLAVAGCSSGPPVAAGRHSRFALGRPNYTVAPYQVNGVWYYPRIDYNYDETGTASWYGPGFNHHPTADGEVYDMNELSAAHKTLPLPSVVAVTNLQNGRELQLRVNDRGPFVGDRLIDVSRRAAQLLGFEGGGTAKVRVRVLKEQSIEVAEAAMHGEMGPVGVGFAAVEPTTPMRTEMAALPPAAARARTEVAALAPSAAQPVAAPVVQPAAGAPVVQAVAPEPPRVQLAAAPPVGQNSLAPTPGAAEPPPTRQAMVTRHYWPSLIAQAHADTLEPAPAIVPRGSGRIFVQAGAFAVAENAQRVRARIANLGSTAIVPATVNGTALYRVRLGPIASEAEARRVLSRVVDSGYPGARLVGE